MYCLFYQQKSPTCLELPGAAVNKRLTVFALEILKDNQNLAKVESNILLLKSTQKRKWMVFSRSSHHPNGFCKKEFGIIRQTHWKASLMETFLGSRSATLVKKKILMNKPFSVNGCKHLWTAASDLGKNLTTLTFMFDSVQNI